MWTLATVAVWIVPEQKPSILEFYIRKWNFHTTQLSQVCTPLFLPKFPIFMNFKLLCSIVSFQQVRMLLSRTEITKLMSPYFSENIHLKRTTVCFILFLFVKWSKWIHSTIWPFFYALICNISFYVV